MKLKKREGIQGRVNVIAQLFQPEPISFYTIFSTLLRWNTHAFSRFEKAAPSETVRV
jgi:hypothetical protein